MLMPSDDEALLDDDTRDAIETSARFLYGLIHARYIVTSRGLQKMVSPAKHRGVWSLALGHVWIVQHFWPDQASLCITSRSAQHHAPLNITPRSVPVADAVA